MITTRQYLDTLGKEFQIIRHLAGKLKEADMDYRPTPGQRSTLELLQYLSFIFDTAAESLVTGSNTWAERAEAAKSLTLADFDAAMGAQELAFHTLFKQLSAEQLAEEVDFWGVKPRSVHFMNAIKWASAYKMQLFLYMKSIGYAHLNTMNVWGGMDKTD
jgi:hypothetical protein